MAEPIPLYTAGADETSAPGWTEDAPIATIDDTAADWREPETDRQAPSDSPPGPPENGAGGYAVEPDVAEPYTDQPVEAPPAAKYASGPWEQPVSPGAPGEEEPVAVEPEDRQSKPDLVPVKPAMTVDTGSPGARSAAAEPVEAARTADGQDSGPVRRLPPADQVFTLPAGEKWPPRPNGSVPIYPTTDVP